MGQAVVKGVQVVKAAIARSNAAVAEGRRLTGRAKSAANLG
jgi:hypothetical protein